MFPHKGQQTQQFLMSLLLLVAETKKGRKKSGKLLKGQILWNLIQVNKKLNSYITICVKMSTSPCPSLTRSSSALSKSLNIQERKISSRETAHRPVPNSPASPI